MPFTLPSRTPPGPRRRSLLASAAGTLVLAGCSTPEQSTDTTAGSPSAADRARARAARDSETLAGRYTAVIAVHPALAERLGPLHAEVVRHAQAFGGTGSSPSASPSVTASPPASPSASPSPSDSASASAASAHPSASPSVPVREKDALSDLASAERTLSDERTKALLEVPGELARLLASVAAAGAAHAFLLTEGAK
ncbi:MULTISPECIES: hypothetical protein [unclassified Streptomyces]|uniref:hypothetical protein n=1 Tax=unclassified Streptomyces TaxID=2593676 RepID=UPI002E804671|nr:hypothetical protein [Streptomyces sp. NBC_00589]WTI35864.1 hypothetical protein OIC96_13070 [Streptomyces sp. NBC_00775]WUB30462.1 hypothetical protein OHA51_36660 [Streptomyces sp. NBC_00589]